MVGLMEEEEKEEEDEVQEEREEDDEEGRCLEVDKGGRQREIREGSCVEDRFEVGLEYRFEERLVVRFEDGLVVRLEVRFEVDVEEKSKVKHGHLFVDDNFDVDPSAAEFLSMSFGMSVQLTIVSIFISASAGGSTWRSPSTLSTSTPTTASTFSSQLQSSSSLLIVHPSPSLSWP